MDRDWLERVRVSMKYYNDGRLHRDFQAKEIENFVQWLYKQYGIEYPKKDNEQ